MPSVASSPRKSSKGLRPIRRPSPWARDTTAHRPLLRSSRLHGHRRADGCKRTDGIRQQLSFADVPCRPRAGRDDRQIHRRCRDGHSGTRHFPTSFMPERGAGGHRHDRRLAGNATRVECVVHGRCGPPAAPKCGIGIATGPCAVGNFGSDVRFEYSAMGDTVNVAARLEVAHAITDSTSLRPRRRDCRARPSNGSKSMSSASRQGAGNPDLHALVFNPGRRL